MGDHTSLEVVAFSPAQILGTSRIQRGTAIITCRAAEGADTNKLRLGYKIPRATKMNRSQAFPNYERKLYSNGG
jgi:hypothetical protein